MPVFEEPVMEAPKTTRKLRKYEKVLIPLMSKPGEWGKIAESKSSSAAYQASLSLRKGRYTIPGDPSNWEFINNDVEIFARWVGDDQDDGSTGEDGSIDQSP